MGWWEAAIPIVGGLLAGSQGGGGTTTSTSSAPWSGQQPYLSDVFQNAQNQFQQSSQYGPFQGPSYAGMNDMQRAALEGQFAQGAQGAQAGQNLYGLADQFAGAGAGAGGAFGDALANAKAGPSDIYSGLQSQFGQGMKDAAGRDISRDLYENQLPANNLGAADAGGARGSRAGAMEAVARRGANDRLADISAQVDSNLMNSATGIWNNQTSGMQNAGVGFAGLGGQAAGLYGAGFGMGQQGLSQQYGAGAGFQADQQAQLDAQRQQYNDMTTGAFGPLAAYGGLVNGNYGSQGSTYTPGPSGLQTGIGTGMSLYSMFNQ